MRQYKKRKFVGEKIGRLKILEELPKKGTRLFMCRCDCGNATKRDYGQLTDSKYKMCRECYDLEMQKLKEKYHKKEKARQKTPTVHSCGKPISEHKRCKRCTIILCDKTNPNHNGYCEECFNIIQNEK